MLNDRLPHTPRVSEPMRWLLPVAACVLLVTIAATPLVRSAEAQAVAPSPPPARTGQPAAMSAAGRAKSADEQTARIEQHVGELIDALERFKKDTDRAEMVAAHIAGRLKSLPVNEAEMAKLREMQAATITAREKATEDALRLCKLIAPLPPTPAPSARPVAATRPPASAMSMYGGGGMGGMGMGGMGGLGGAYGGMGAAGGAYGGGGGMGIGRAYGGSVSFGPPVSTDATRNSLLITARQFQSSLSERTRTRGLADQGKASRAEVIVANTLMDEATDTLTDGCRRLQAAHVLTALAQRRTALQSEIDRVDRALRRLRDRLQAGRVDQATVSVVEKRRTELNEQFKQAGSESQRVWNQTFAPKPAKTQSPYGGPTGGMGAGMGMGGMGMGGMGMGGGAYGGSVAPVAPEMRQVPQVLAKPTSNP